MTEATPGEEPSVLISAKVLEHLVELAYDEDGWSDTTRRAVEEAESALERYK